jgi:hypothetical protein
MKTTAKNLEEKFDKNEDVLDYFNKSKAQNLKTFLRKNNSKNQDKVYGHLQK